MIYAKCKEKCELEDNLADPDICCYWCDKRAACVNPCTNEDCKVVKEIQLEDSQY